MQSGAAHGAGRPAPDGQSKRSVHGCAFAEWANTGWTVARRSTSKLLLAGPQTTLRCGNGRLVARSGRRSRWPIAARAPSYVLGRLATVASERAAFRPASQWAGGDGAVMCLSFVGGRSFELG